MQIGVHLGGFPSVIGSVAAYYIAGKYSYLMCGTLISSNVGVPSWVIFYSDAPPARDYFAVRQAPHGCVTWHTQP